MCPCSLCLHVAATTLLAMVGVTELLLMAVSAGGLVWFQQALGKLILSVHVVSTGPSVYRAYELLGDFHTLPSQHMLSCCFPITVPPSTSPDTYTAHSHELLQKHPLQHFLWDGDKWKEDPVVS